MFLDVTIIFLHNKTFERTVMLITAVGFIFLIWFILKFN